MLKNPWFTLILGLMVGLAVGYLLAEMQPVPPARVPVTGGGGESTTGALPEGHPPVPEQGQAAASVASQSRELQQLLEQNPEDSRLLIALGNLHFDAGDWPDARAWYERALEVGAENPDVITDLAVVYRNLKQPERALENLDRAIQLAPEHWQAWHNKVVILQFDLHLHDEAAQALERLEEIGRSNPAVPDLSSLQQQIRGG